MMKRISLIAAALAVLAVVANGAVLQFQVLPSAPQGGTSADGSLATGGDYVAGYGYNTNLGFSYAFPVYWATDPNGGTAPVRNEVNGGWGAGNFGGIDKKAGGTLFTSSNSGGTRYSAADFIGRAGTPGALTVLKSHLGFASDVTVGGNNSTAATSNGDAAWIAGSWTGGTSSKGSDGQIWLTSDAAYPSASYHPTHTSGTKVDLRSIASNGTAVGQAKDAIGWSGATGRPRAVFWTTADTGKVYNIPSFAGNGITTEAQGFGVSDNGQKFTGLMWTNVDANARAFRWTMGDANSEKLIRPAGWIGTPTAVYGYDVLDSGMVAGSAYMDDSALPKGLAGNHDTGTVWMPGETTGRRVMDMLINAGMWDKVQDIRFLGRCYGIAQLDDGKVALSGEGSFFLNPEHSLYGTRGWYAVIPEPATIGFLALGGLALLRRRR